MRPQHLVDCLYAAAVWEKGAAAAAAAAAASPSSLGSSSSGGGGSTGSSSSSSTANNMSLKQTPAGGPAQQRGLPSDLLNRPQHRPTADTQLPTSTSSSSSSSSSQRTQSAALSAAISSKAAAAAAAAAATPRQWLEALLQRLRPQFAACSPRQLTTALWALGQFDLKAPVDWLDGLYDALLLQLPGCSLSQLLHLLQGLLHQQHDLAPARIDAVLQQCLLRLQQQAPADAVAAGAGGSGGTDNSSGVAAAGGLQGRQRSMRPGQVVLLLKLVVKLRHDPDPQWCVSVAETVLHMLLQQQERSVHTCTSPVVLAALLEQMTLLEFDLPPATVAGCRAMLLPVLPHSTGRQLAMLLSATARLHWYQRPEAPTSAAASAAGGAGVGAAGSAVSSPVGRQARRLRRQQQQQQQREQEQQAQSLAHQGHQRQQQRRGQVLLQRLLRQLRWHLRALDPSSLGRVGAAVSQLGLRPHPDIWGEPFMAAVRAVVGSRVLLSAAEVADLQCSVQHLSWCRRVGSSRRFDAARGRRAGRRVLKIKSRRAGATRRRRQAG
jgi:hypothetical protein